MYFNAHLRVTIAGKLIQTVVSAKIVNDVQNFGSSLDIVVSLNCRISYLDPNQLTVYLTAEATTLFSSGDPVSVIAYYDGYPQLNVFNGYVYDFVMGMPLTIKCLDETYNLNLNLLNLSYKSITLKQLAENIIAGTGVSLILPTLDLTLVNITFKDMSAAAIFEWIKKQLGLNISLMGTQLYINIASNTTGQVNYQTDRNVLANTQEHHRIGKHSAGLQKNYAAFRHLKVKAWFIRQDGTKDSVEVGDEDGVLREVFFYKLPQNPTLYNTLANAALLKYTQHKYNGTIDTLLYPDVNLYYKAQYIDIRYPERNGNYSVMGIETEFSEKGFRRKVKLAWLSDLDTNATAVGPAAQASLQAGLSQDAINAA